MIYEFTGNPNKLDPMSRDIIMCEMIEDFIEEGYSEKEAEEMAKMYFDNMLD